MVALRRFEADPLPPDRPIRNRPRTAPHDVDWRLGYIVFAMSASVVALAVSLSCALWLAAARATDPAATAHPPVNDRIP